MIFKSPYHVDIVHEDILTFLFSRGNPEDERPLWLNAQDPSQCINRPQALQLLKRIAHALRKLGVGADGRTTDVVITFAENQVMITPTVFGILCANAINATSSPLATDFELAGQLKGSSPKAIFCSPQTYEVAKTARARSGLKDIHILLLKSTAPFDILSEDGQSILTSGTLEWTQIRDPSALASRTALLLYSSGTTGAPKGVPLSHSNIVSNIIQMNYHLTPYFAQLRRDENALLAMPGILSNSVAAGSLVHNCMAVFHGLQVYQVEKYNLDTLVRLIHTHRLNVVFLAPSIYQQLAQSDSITPQHLQSLRYCMCGGAVLPSEIRRAVAKKFAIGKQITVMENWGMTEMVCAGAQFPVNRVLEEGSVGQLMPNMEAKVVDSQGKELGPDEVGDLLVRGPNIIRGYYNNPQADKSAFKGDWLDTGDVVKFSKAGNLVLELIKYKGNQVPPAQLEGILLEHPSVIDVGVVGVPVGAAGEVPCAYIVVKDRSISEQEVAAWLEPRVSAYKRLRGGVVFVDAIPRNLAGKIQRNILREWVKNDSIRPRL